MFKKTRKALTPNNFLYYLFNNILTELGMNQNYISCMVDKFLEENSTNININKLKSFLNAKKDLYSKEKTMSFKSFIRLLAIIKVISFEINIDVFFHNKVVNQSKTVYVKDFIEKEDETEIKVKGKKKDKVVKNNILLELFNKVLIGSEISITNLTSYINRYIERCYYDKSLITVDTTANLKKEIFNRNKFMTIKNFIKALNVVDAHKVIFKIELEFKNEKSNHEMTIVFNEIPEQ